MKSPIKSMLLIAASLLCLYGFAWLAFSKGVHISDTVDTAVGVAVLLSSLALPVAGFRSLRGHRGTPWYRTLVFPAFLISLAPAVIILYAILVVLIVRPPDETTHPVMNLRAREARGYGNTT